MVGCGFTLMAVSLVYWIARRRRREDGRTLLRVLVLAAPLGYLALEAGWIMTEVGRQPWVIYGIMRTADGVTPVDDVPITFFGFTLLYVGLGIVLTYLLRKLASPHAAAERHAAPAPLDGVAVD